MTRNWIMAATACLGIGAVGAVLAIGFGACVCMAARTVSDVLDEVIL